MILREPVPCAPRLGGAVALRVARQRGRRDQAGFTLIELTIALLAGLIVSMALVQVSKEANNTFHEEVRTAAAEMSLRIALERLRMDLQRVAYMSTGNIQNDPSCAKRVGSASCLSNAVAPVAGLTRLAGIQLQFGGSFAATPLSADPNNVLNPDSIDLGGNYSSTDEFVGFMCPTPPGGGGCGGQTICLEWNTPAMWRIRNTGANASATLQSYFNPSYSTNPTAGPGATRFMARITDDSGHYVYVLTCGGAGTTSWGAAGAAVSIDPATKILTTADTRGRGGVAGLGAGRVIISPVELVHWQLQAASTIPIAGSNGFGVTAPGVANPNEYVLTRQYVDAVANTPDPNTMEVVSEFAVDLKFAFTVDSQIPPNNPPGGYLPAANPLLPLLLDSNTNAAWAYDVSLSPPLSQGPHRIRSVRVRAAIRAQAPDRIVNVTPASPTFATTGQPYMYRYYIPGPAGGLLWARVRTGVTEVSLPNQARFFW
jgi:prepilin-type N-terminal cleavage/methylation domain-containing protein